MRKLLLFTILILLLGGEACNYPVQPAEVPFTLASYKQKIDITENRKRMQMSAECLFMVLGREKRLRASVHCIRPVNDVRPISLEGASPGDNARRAYVEKTILGTPVLLLSFIQIWHHQSLGTSVAL